MFMLVLTFGGLAFRGLITANPLLQSLQSCPAVYQQNPYPHHYNDQHFIFQPNNINPYLQQLLVQNHLSAYQIQASINDQINQLYWEKIFSNPALYGILIPNSGIHNQNNEVQRISHPYNSGGVVNNYIIVPPEYITNNKTVDRNNGNGKRVIKIKDSKKRVNTINKKKEVNNRRHANRRRAMCNQVKMNKIKTECNAAIDERKPDNNQDILDDILTTVKKILPLKEIEAKRDSVQESTVNTLNDNFGSERKKESQSKGQKESKKLNSNVSETVQYDKNKEQRKLKCNLSETEDLDKNKEQGKLNKSKKKKSSKRRKSDKPKIQAEVSHSCECVEEDEILKYFETTEDNLNKMKDPSKRKCIQDVDWFDINQDYVDLDKRRTRNSKNDVILTDFRNMYPDLPDDVSKSFTKYVNDLMANPQTANTNLLYPNNMYPFDFSQIYQTPQYPTTESNKPNANRKRKRKNKRRNKQKSKKNPKKKKGQKESRNDATDIREEQDAVTEVAPIVVKLKPVKVTSKVVSTTEQTTTVGENTPIETYMSEEELESFEEPSMNETPAEIKIETVETTTNNLVVTTTKATTSVTENIPETHIFEEEVLETFEEPDIKSEVLEIGDVKLRINQNNEKEINVKESKKEILGVKKEFETQIPDSVQKIHEHRDTLESFYDTPDLGLEDKLPHLYENGIYNDYYPDFTADNHAYLLSEEAFDLLNIHDRYFYTTDKNIDSDEIKNDNNIKSNYKNVNLEKYEHVHRGVSEKEKLQTDYNRDKIMKPYSSEEIVFRTPPGLDVPDFRTRKVNKDRHDSTEIAYQHSNHDEYDRFNFDNVADKTESVISTADYNYGKADDKPQSLVETVYARSKVVKYGQSQDFDRVFSPSYSDDVVHKTHYAEDGKTIVFAKSLSPDDMW